MKTAFRAMTVALALIGSPAQAEEPPEKSLSEFLDECMGNPDYCRAFTHAFIPVFIEKFSFNPDPACVPIEPYEAADSVLQYMFILGVEPEWAEGSSLLAMAEAVLDSYPCLTDE
ncbi:hypothetical protein [Parvibaculum sp.]|uniref:hypothetical protein n=1 Tax=Parvibaculum sp. TaxID=2024848 RepID=UPI0038B3E764